MNKYTVEVILHSGTTAYVDQRIVYADFMSTSSGGYYNFYNKEGKVFALYPIVNTIIREIEYDFQK